MGKRQCQLAGCAKLARRHGYFYTGMKTQMTMFASLESFTTPLGAGAEAVVVVVSTVLPRKSTTRPRGTAWRMEGASAASTRAAPRQLQAARPTSDELTVLYSNGPDDRSVKLALGYVTAATSGC
jgi:hypothetical protein